MLRSAGAISFFKAVYNRKTPFPCYSKYNYKSDKVATATVKWLTYNFYYLFEKR